MTVNATVTLLKILLSLFLFRVFVQLLQFNRDLPYLPSFEAWHSATIPYSWLLFSQVLITFAIITVIIRIHRGLYVFYKTRALLLLWFGAIYFIFMLVRFTLSISILTTHHWFGATLPALFHMVLASVFIVTGLYEYHGFHQKTNGT